LEIFRKIGSKLTNRAYITAPFSPPTLIREGKFVPTRDEDDEMVVHRSPLLELCHPEIDEPPIATLVVLPQSIHKARNVPTIPTLIRSVGQRDTGRVIPR